MTMEFWIALGAAVLGAASLLLHFIAPRTKTTKDDKVLEVVDKAKDYLGGKN
jgi:hypothetical protein